MLKLAEIPFSTIFWVCALFIFAFNSHASETCKSFSANGINNWYPFVYRTDDNELTGTIPDAAQTALARIGLKMEFQADRPWKRILYELEAGKLDIVLGAYWNSDRAKKYHFSEILGTDEIRVFVRKGSEFSLNSFEDLIGRRGLKLLGGSYGDKFDKFADAHLDFHDIQKSDQMIKMIAGARADFGILGYIEGLEHIQNNNLEGQVVALPWPILSNSMYLMVSRTAPCAHRVDDMNAAIQQMQKEGVLEQIFSKHIAMKKTKKH